MQRLRPASTSRTGGACGLTAHVEVNALAAELYLLENVRE